MSIRSGNIRCRAPQPGRVHATTHHQGPEARQCRILRQRAPQGMSPPHPAIAVSQVGGTAAGTVAIDRGSGTSFLCDSGGSQPDFLILRIDRRRMGQTTTNTLCLTASQFRVFLRAGPLGSREFDPAFVRDCASCLVVNFQNSDGTIRCGCRVGAGLWPGCLRWERTGQAKIIARVQSNCPGNCLERVKSRCLDVKRGCVWGICECSFRRMSGDGRSA